MPIARMVCAVAGSAYDGHQSGNTPIGATNWQALSNNAIYTDVNTAPQDLQLHRAISHRLVALAIWNAQGFNAIYSPTATGFRVYLRV